MTDAAQTFIYLPGGGGGGEKDLAAFAEGLEYPVRFNVIGYPGWQRYVEDDFSAEALIVELTAEVVRRVPTGPIRLMGMSIGGHFGYAVALRLQEMGRTVLILCAIDSFIVSSSQPSAGWQKRAFADAFDLIKKLRFEEFARLIRSKVWRGLLRLAGGRLASILRRFSSDGKLPQIFRSDAVAEQELSMRLLLRAVAPWVAKLDRNPTPLMAPTILLRTQSSAAHDAAWRRRCPQIAIREVPGKHLTLFEPENIDGLRDAFVAATSVLTVESCSLRATAGVH